MMKELLEKRARLRAEMKSLNDKAKAESRSFDQGERDQWAKMVEDLGHLDEEVRIAEQREAFEATITKNTETAAEVRNVSKDEAKEKADQAFRKFILHKAGMDSSWSAEDTRWLDANPFKEFRTNTQSTTDNKGGYTIPTGFSNELTLARLAWGGVERVARVIRTESGNDIEWPYANDTAVVAYQINEATDFGSSATDVTFAQATLKAWKWTSGLVKVNAELLQDSAFDMSRILADLFGLRMGRGTNAAFTTGAGTTVPQGVVTGAASASVTATVSTITYADMVDLMHAVDPAYAINGTWMFNNATLGYLRKLEDTEGQLIWQPSAIPGAPDTFLGKPYVVNQDMASIGASAKSVLFGDFQNYVIRYAGPDRFKVLTERFAETDQIALVLITRLDGQLIDAGTHPIKYLIHAAT